MVFAPGTKNHCICSVLWPAPCKNSGIYAVFSMLQEVLFPCQKPKNTVYKLQCFGFWHPMKNVRKTSENNQKCPKWSFSFNLQKRGKWGLVFLSSPQAGSGLTFPKRSQIRASPPTPPRLASLRFAYTYTQPRPSAGFRNIPQYIYIHMNEYICFLIY